MKSRVGVYLFLLLLLTRTCPKAIPWEDRRGVSPPHTPLFLSEGEHVSRKESRSAVFSSSPTAMTVTRTSASAELMASDKCVMGSYQGQRFTAAEAPNGRTRMCLHVGRFYTAEPQPWPLWFGPLRRKHMVCCDLGNARPRCTSLYSSTPATTPKHTPLSQTHTHREHTHECNLYALLIMIINYGKGVVTDDYNSN